jgi:hypothetical protein
MEEIVDLFGGNEETIYDDIIMNKDEPKEYYIGKAEFILKQLDDNINYYEFLKIILKKYNTLNENQKAEIIEFMNIPEREKIVEKVKIVYKETKKKKTKINFVDDY